MLHGDISNITNYSSIGIRIEDTILSPPNKNIFKADYNEPKVHKSGVKLSRFIFNRTPYTCDLVVSKEWLDRYYGDKLYDLLEEIGVMYNDIHIIPFDKEVDILLRTGDLEMYVDENEERRNAIYGNAYSISNLSDVLRRY